MKKLALFAAILSLALLGSLYAQDANNDALDAPPDIIIDENNPGLAFLDQATEAKLRANNIADLSRVIILCQRAKRAGLVGENLEYCDQLLASTHLQRGLFFAQQLLTPANIRAGDWQDVRQAALDDLEEAVAVIANHPAAYLRIAQLNMLPDGNEDRAKTALKLAIQTGKEDSALQVQAVLLLADLEQDAEKRETVLAEAAKDGNPEIVFLHSLALFELNRNDEAAEVLQKMLETDQGNAGLHERVIALLSEFREYEPAIVVLDMLQDQVQDADRRNRLELLRAEIFAKMERYDDAFAILNGLLETSQNNRELSLLALLLRSATHLAMYNFEEALKDVEAAEEFHPTLIPVLEHKYKIFIEMENYAEALAVIKQLRTVEDRPHFALREIIVLAELEQYDDAIAVVQRLQDEYPEDGSQWITLLVEIYLKKEDYEKAFDLVAEQLKGYPDDLRWIITKAKVLSAQEHWDDAVSWLELYLEDHPDSMEVQLELVSTLFRQKRFGAARERVQSLLEKHPGNVILLHFDSQASISLGLHAEAIAVLEQLVELDSEDYTSINNLAWILCTSPKDEVRDGARAVELAERAAELSRHRRAFVLSTLAAAYAEIGDFEKAREISVKSVEVANAERGMTEKERQDMLEHLQKEWDAFIQDLPFRELLDEEEP
ncbi:MAG: tetratricopeptide repeat protein [Planctomycetaceae bacterium]|nr:tetratricopeptide repeat protein [Planctomycetaceae bacterium]